MVLRKFIVISMVLLGFSTSIYPQLNEMSQFELETRKNRKVIIPFKLINNLIVFPLSINGSDTLNFVLDTGVASTLITELPNDTEIGFNYLRTVKISGLGDGESIDVLYSPGNNLTIGKAVGINQDILVMTEDIFQLSSLLGTYVHGLIGFAVFKDFIVEIDYRLKRLILHDHDKYGERYKDKKRSKKWEVVPLTMFKQKPYIDVEIEQKDSTSASLKLLLDSGASHGMALYYTANDEIHLPEKRLRSFLGSGISGEINGYLGKIDKLKINKFEMDEVVASYPDDEGIKRAVLYSDRDGSIGAEVLKRFKIFFNYRDETMIIRPQSMFNDKFSYNMSGLEISTPYPNIPLYSISHVRDSSVAQKVGFQQDDLILKINGKGSQEYSLTDLHRLFEIKNNRIWIQIMRGTETLTKEFKLIDELD